jgi:hypothetical protein
VNNKRHEWNQQNKSWICQIECDQNGHFWVIPYLKVYAIYNGFGSIVYWNFVFQEENTVCINNKKIKTKCQLKFGDFLSLTQLVENGKKSEASIFWFQVSKLMLFSILVIYFY